MRSTSPLLLAVCLALSASPARADQLDDLLSEMRSGTAVTAPAMRKELLATARDSTWKAYDEAIVQSYLWQIKASIIDHDNHGGWPCRSWLVQSNPTLREQLTKALQERYAEKPNSLLAYALVCPALYAEDNKQVGQLESYLKEKDPFLYRQEQTQIDGFWRSYIKSVLKSEAEANAKPAPGSQTPAAAPFATEDEAFTTLKSYLDRMGFPYSTDLQTKGSPRINLSREMDNATHRMRVVLDKKADLVYVFLNHYLTMPGAGPNRDQALQTLMKLNWDLNIGKFEWDPSDGEIRYSYCFSTENGIGYDAFRAVVKTILDTGDKKWPDLKKIIDGQ